MKTNIIDIEEKEVPFPKIMRSTNSGCLYLMTDPEEGTKLAEGPDGPSGCNVGTFRTDWTRMQDFTGSITLSN